MERSKKSKVIEPEVIEKELTEEFIVDKIEELSKRILEIEPETIEVYTEESDEPIEIIVGKPIALHWRKVGGGSLRFANKIIKPGEDFWATLDEIPKPFLNALVCLSTPMEIAKAKRMFPDTSDVKFEIRETNTGLYDVCNYYGKPINDKPLKKEDAEILKANLEA